VTDSEPILNARPAPTHSSSGMVYVPICVRGAEHGNGFGRQMN